MGKFIEKFNEMYLFLIAIMIAIICWTYYESTICKKIEYVLEGTRQYIRMEETYKCECDEK